MPYLDMNAVFLTTSATANLFANAAAVSGDVLTVRSLDASQDARLLALGVQQADNGLVRLTSPFLHDDVNAIRSTTIAADPTSILDMDALQPLRAQDPLTFAVANETAAAEVAVGYWLTYYKSLSGGPSIYITPQELKARSIELNTTSLPVTTIAGGGAWGTSALSNGSGVLKADQVYAVLGYTTDVLCTAIALQGPDTGNFKAGGPGIITPRQFTRRWFVDLARESGEPTIPCFNSQNASGTLVYAIAPTAVTPNITFLLARLRK